MPCFKGLAVSIHTPDGPLPEHAIQKQSRLSRVNIFVPVPPPKLPKDSKSTKAEQSTFAISITLLTPGLSVPYSMPKSTPENPYPRPQVVSGLPMLGGDRGNNRDAPTPYVPLTTSPNETVAAYIYFDGRAKEEVATLLRRGEETWVNSRWVGVPESEGGGLAEREFLFREVGLERWLNGLDLEGKDAAAKIERRRQKIERKRRRRRTHDDSDDGGPESSTGKRRERPDRGVLRYGIDSQKPLEQMSDSEDMFSSDTDSDDDPIPESAGQIKVALFRVLASGEIRRGEYSPQFDAHDDSTDMGGKGADDAGEEVDHTTSFAQPKTLDPKSISTQTVTGIDPSDRPFAVFTFLYRGEKQLQKMGILPGAVKEQEKTPSSNGQRRSMQADFSNLKPLNPNGLKGFSQFRDPSERNDANGRSKDKSSKKSSGDVDSDDDIDLKDEPDIKIEEGGDNPDSNAMLSPEDARRQGELAEGVQKIRLKRQHSASEVLSTASPAQRSNNSPPSYSPKTGSASPPPASAGAVAGSPPPLLPSIAFEGTSMPSPNVASSSHGHDVPGGGGISGSAAAGLSTSDIVGSPLKKQRSSLPGGNDDGDSVHRRLGKGLGLGMSGLGSRDVMGSIEGMSQEPDSTDNHGSVSRFGGMLDTGASTTTSSSSHPAPIKDEDEDL